MVERQMPEYEQPRLWLRQRGAGLHAILPKQRNTPPQGELFDSGI